MIDFLFQKLSADFFVLLAMAQAPCEFSKTLRPFAALVESAPVGPNLAGRSRKLLDRSAAISMSVRCHRASEADAIRSPVVMIGVDWIYVIFLWIKRGFPKGRVRGRPLQVKSEDPNGRRSIRDPDQNRVY